MEFDCQHNRQSHYLKKFLKGMRKAMAYNLDGALLEVCTCNILCPC
jgi:hypothetical protein